MNSLKNYESPQKVRQEKRVLLVDDSPVALALIGEMLEELNYRVTTAENGLEALEQVKANPFDLIITDLNMPGMDGIEFASNAKKTMQCRFTPIIMLSSEEDSEMISKAKKMGISTFLSKPIKQNKLDAILNIILGR